MENATQALLKYYLFSKSARRLLNDFTENSKIKWYSKGKSQLVCLEN